MVVQVATVWTLLDVAVLREVLHADPHVDHRLPAVLTVQAGLQGKQEAVSHTTPLPPSITNQHSRLLTWETDQEFNKASLYYPKQSGQSIR